MKYFEQMQKNAVQQYGGDELNETIAEKEARERERYIREHFVEMHSGLDYDAAVKAVDELDYRGLPGVERKNGDYRIYCKLVEPFALSYKYTYSFTVLIEESPRFGSDITLMLSCESGGAVNLMNKPTALIKNLKKLLQVVD